MLASGDERHGREGESKKSAPYIAQEYFCRRPIVEEKSQGRKGKHTPVKINIRKPNEVPDKQPADSRRHRLDAGDSIDAVHKVIGIGQPHDPAEGKDGTEITELYLCIEYR